MNSFKTLREKMKDPCWKNYKMIGTKKKGDQEVPNCVPEEVKKGLYYYVNLRKKAGISRPASSPKAPSDQDWKDAAKTAKKESVSEAKEKQEYDYEGDMARSQLRSIIANAQAVHDMLKPDTNMAEWVQSKITLAADYISTAADYMQSERNEVSEAAPAWTRKEGKSPSGGLNAKGIASYRRANPGSKLSMAVTTPPSKLDPDGKAAKRRKSFCARMGGSKGPMKDEKGEPTRKALALRKWNC